MSLDLVKSLQFRHLFIQILQAFINKIRPNANLLLHFYLCLVSVDFAQQNSVVMIITVSFDDFSLDYSNVHSLEL